MVKRKQVTWKRPYKMNEVKEHLSYFTTRQAHAKVSGSDEVAPLLAGADGGGCVSLCVTCTFFDGTHMASCRRGGIVFGVVRLSAIGLTLASSLVDVCVCVGDESS